jgi:hypothetical protein
MPLFLQTKEALRASSVRSFANLVVAGLVMFLHLQAR